MNRTTGLPKQTGCVLNIKSTIFGKPKNTPIHLCRVYLVSVPNKVAMATYPCVLHVF